MSAEAEKYYHSKKWGNPHWDRKTATIFDKSEMFDFAESYHQHRLNQLTDERIEEMFPRLPDGFEEKPEWDKIRWWQREGAKALRDHLKNNK